uniref:NAD_binding_6 domain-containing protein n=1 Tax=Mesocestoides corti TaxID=53468 RepID=A0A5K3FPG2_MESCO
MLESVLRTLMMSRNSKHVYEMVDSRIISSGMNFTRLLDPIQYKIDAVILISGPALAMKFVVEVQNLSRILQGRIAIVHVDPLDSFTYDVLRTWRYFLSTAVPT